MKVLCKRTYFERVGHDIRWEKGKLYEMEFPSELERDAGVYCHIQDNISIYHPYITYSIVRKSEFDKYFIEIDENRNNKIEQILK